MAEKDNIRDLLSSMAPDDRAASRRILDLLDEADASPVDVPGAPGREGGRIRTDDEAWSSLSARLGIGATATDRGRAARPARPFKLRILAPATAIAACIAFLFWFGQPVRFVVSAGDSASLSLPDGTTVRMNSGSTLNYRRYLGAIGDVLGWPRHVSMSGEVFFDVSQDADRPFIVRTENATISVTGTEFNVRARQVNGEALTRVTLISGGLDVDSRMMASQPESIVPGQTVELVGAGRAVDRTDVVAQQVVSWLDGGFSHSNESLRDIAAEISRRFRVRVDFGEHVDPSRQMTLHYAEATSPEVIIHDLCLGTGLQYRRVAGGYRIETGP